RGSKIVRLHALVSSRFALQRTLGGAGVIGAIRCSWLAPQKNDAESESSGGTAPTKPRGGMSPHFVTSLELHPGGHSEHPRLREQKDAAASCEYAEADPQRFFFTLNAPE